MNDDDFDGDFDDYGNRARSASEIEAARRKAEEFYLRVAIALSGCQLVEQQLKLYIAEAFKLVHKFVGHRMPFNMSGADYERSPLQGLIKMLRKLCDNKQLIKDLEAFQNDRDFVSHNAIAYCLDPMDELNYNAMAEIETQLARIPNEAERLRAAINDEANKFRGFLYFEDVESPPETKNGATDTVPLGTDR
jgi:hypothetical protein